MMADVLDKTNCNVSDIERQSYITMLTGNIIIQMGIQMQNYFYEIMKYTYMYTWLFLGSQFNLRY